MLPAVKGVFFDYGGTLAAGESPAEVFRSGLESMGIQIGNEESLRLERLVRSYWAANYSKRKRGSRWSRSIEAECNAYALSNSGVARLNQVSAGKLAERWDDFRGLRIYNDVVQTLDILRKDGYVMAVVSQNLQTSGELEEKLRHFGIAGYFSTIVTSESAGYDKPDPRLFSAAREALGMDSENICYLGDVYELDVVGSRSAGMVPVLIDRSGATVHADVLTISTLAELPGHLTARRKEPE